MISENIFEKNRLRSFHVLDIDELNNRVDYLRSKLPDNISLCYAVKANSFIVKELIGKVDKFEICSPGETHICKALGIKYNSMVISGVYKKEGDLEELIEDNEFDGIITAESMHQFEMIKELSSRYKHSVKVLPRLTNDSQFGMNEEDLFSLLVKSKDDEYINICGIQFFSGTQKTSLKKYRRELNYLDNFLTKLKEEYDITINELEYGTGFPVNYFVGEEFDENELLSGFSDIVRDMSNPVHITIEVGRSLATSCGCYYAPIVELKHNKNKNYVMIDGGMHHLVYFGQHMGMKLPYITVKDKTAVNENVNWIICGSLCSMNDIVVNQVFLPDIEVGDYICFHNTGAYCLTEGIALFLTRDIPAVYMKKDGVYSLLRESLDTSDINMPNYSI